MESYSVSGCNARGIKRKKKSSASPRGRGKYRGRGSRIFLGSRSRGRSGSKRGVKVRTTTRLLYHYDNEEQMEEKDEEAENLMEDFDTISSSNSISENPAACEMASVASESKGKSKVKLIRDAEFELIEDNEV